MVPGSESQARVNFYHDIAMAFLTSPPGRLDDEPFAYAKGGEVGFPGVFPLFLSNVTFLKFGDFGDFGDELDTDVDHFAIGPVARRLGHIRSEDGTGAFWRRFAFVGVPPAGFFDGYAALTKFTKKLGDGFDELEWDFDFEL